MGAIRANVNLNFAIMSTSVDVVSAVSEGESRIHNVCTGVDSVHEITRTRQDLYCPECNNKDRTTFKKAEEITKGHYRIVTPEIIEEVEVPIELKTSISLTAHPATNLEDLLILGKSYYLKPTSIGTKNGYKLFVEMLERADCIFMAEWAPRSVVGLFLVRVYKGTLLLQQVARLEEVNEPPETFSGEFDAKVIPTIIDLTKTMSTPLNVDTYRNDRKNKMEAFLASQPVVQGNASISQTRGAKPTVDILAELQSQYFGDVFTSPKKKMKK